MQVIDGIEYKTFTELWKEAVQRLDKRTERHEKEISPARAKFRASMCEQFEDENMFNDQCRGWAK